MNYYKFDKENLTYVPVEKTDRSGWLLALAFIYLLTIPLLVGTTTVETESPVVRIDNTVDNFSEEKLIRMLINLNVKHPHIVLAQARHETGHYTSNIFKKNHNLFGMKEARVRVHTAEGTQMGHAYYQDWKHSVIDYALYQASYLQGLTEDQYLNAIGSVYAEDPNYQNRITQIIKEGNLKELFYEKD